MLSLAALKGPGQVVSQKEERIHKGQIKGKRTVIIQVDEDFLS